MDSGNEMKPQDAGLPGSGASNTSELDLQKLADLINARYPGRYDAWKGGCVLSISCPVSYRQWHFRADAENVQSCDLDDLCARFTNWGLDRLQDIWDGHWTRAIGSNIEYSVDLIGNPKSGGGFFIEVTVYPESDAFAVAETYQSAPYRALAVYHALVSELSQGNQPGALLPFPVNQKKESV